MAGTGSMVCRGVEVCDLAASVVREVVWLTGGMVETCGVKSRSFG